MKIFFTVLSKNIEDNVLAFGTAQTKNIEMLKTFFLVFNMENCVEDSVFLECPQMWDRLYSSFAILTEAIATALLHSSVNTPNLMGSNVSSKMSFIP